MLKKRMKKILQAIVACALLSMGVCSFGSCQCAPTTDEPAKETVSFNLNYHICELSLYDSLQLEVDGFETIDFTSDNPSIVSVDQSTGIITALAYGTANISAKSGEYTDTCIVTVANEGFVPSLTTAVGGNKFSLFIGDTFDLQTEILFNGNYYTDGEVKYEISDPTKASVDENGVVSAKAYGEVLISINAQWRGFDSFYLSDGITLTVVPDISIELSANEKKIYTVQEEIAGETYHNQTQLTWEILRDRKPVVNGDITFESSDNEVLTVNTDGEVEGLKKGSAEVVLIYTLENVEYRSLPVEIKVDAPEKVFAENTLCYDVNTLSDVCLTGIEGELLSVRAKTEDYGTISTFADGALVLSGEKLKKLHGEVEFIVETSVYTYRVSTIFATHLIGTFDEYKAFNASYTGTGGDTNKSDNWYVVLTNDINCDGADMSKTNNDLFAGTFNGLGHVISNVCVSGKNASLFGGLKGSTVIENLGLVNIVGKSSDCYLLAGFFYGSGATIRNIYLKGEYTAAATTGFARQGNSSKIANCIVDITYPDGADESVAIATEGSSDYISNTYAIGNATNFATSYKTIDEQKVCISDTRKVYPTAQEFVSECKTEINAENGWNKYWSQDGTTVYFNGDSIMPLGKTARTLKAQYKKDTFTVNIAEYLSETVKNVYINDKPIEAQNGVITINPSEYIVGTQNRLSIFGETDSVTLPFVAVTHTISTANEFQTFRNYTQTDTFATTAAYAVLLNDIYYADCTIQGTDLGETNTGFYGIFNGLGHTIYNWTVTCAGGVFGAIRGDATEIKNVAFVNLTNTRGETTSNAGLLGGYIYRGIFSNVYVKGSFASTHGNFGVFSRGNNRNFTNCIFDITYPTDSTYNAFGFNIGTVTNVYLIGNAKQLAANNTTTPYATASACVSAIGQTLANVSANDYWTMQNNELYFGNTKVE